MTPPMENPITFASPPNPLKMPLPKFQTPAQRNNRRATLSKALVVLGDLRDIASSIMKELHDPEADQSAEAVVGAGVGPMPTFRVQRLMIRRGRAMIARGTSCRMKGTRPISSLSLRRIKRIPSRA